MTLRTCLHAAWLALWVVPMAVALVTHVDFAASWQAAADTSLWTKAGRGLTALLRDGLYLGAVLFLLSFGARVNWIYRVALRAAALLLVAIVVADAMVALRTYGVRLQWDETLPYLSLSAVAGYLKIPMTSVVALFVALDLLLLALLLPRGPTALGAPRWAWTGAALVAVGLAAQFGIRLDNEWVLQPAPLAFSVRTADWGYDSDFQAPDLAQAAAPVRCRPFALAPQDRPRNVLVVLAESWTAEHSRRIAGENALDLVPNFDAWSRRGRLYANFRANGFATVHGLVALLTGNVPAPPPRPSVAARLSFMRHDSVDGEQALLRLAARHGWRSLFVIPGDGDYTHKREWLRELGIGDFEMRADAEDFYEPWPRFIFDGAPDEALYRYWLSRMDARPQPYVAFLETMSSHFPYVNPEDPDDSDDPRVPFRYADRWLGWFLQRLDERGFYRDNLLIVVSDHSWMSSDMVGHLSRKPAGSDDFAYDAHVPLLMIGKGVEPGVEGRRYQQTDLYNGLRGMVSGRSCTHRAMGDVFADPPRCTLHAMGTDRSALFVECGQGRQRRHARMVLAAETTHFAPQGALDKEDEDWLLNWVHAWRHRQQHHEWNLPFRQNAAPARP